MSQSILLTGATGVVGSSVLPFIINNSDWNVQVLIRAQSAADADVRLKELCDFIQDQIHSDQKNSDWQARIKAIPGDLDSVQFGLSDDVFRGIGKKLKHIVHCAASVDLTRPQKEAVASTTLATKQILDLLAINSDCQLQYVSTVGVNGRLTSPLQEERMLSSRSFFNSYEMAKAKSEELVYTAIDRGQRITIHRPSMVVGNSQTGRIIHFQVFYFLLRLITGELTGGLLPPLLFRKLDTIPCDFVGQLIFESMTRKDLSGKIIHLCSGPEQAFTLGQIRDVAKWIYEKHGRKPATLRQLPNIFFRVVSLAQYLTPPGSKWKKRLELLPQFLAYAGQDQKFKNDRSKALFPSVSWPQPSDYMNQVIEYYVLNYLR